MARKTKEVEIKGRTFTLTQMAASEAIEYPPMILKICPIKDIMDLRFTNVDAVSLKNLMMRVINSTENVKLDDHTIVFDRVFDNDLSAAYMLFAEVIKFNFSDFFLEMIPFLTQELVKIPTQSELSES